MKKLIVLAFFITLITAFNAYPQYVRLNGYALYTFDDAIESSNGYYYFNGTIKANLLWGAGIEFNPMPDYGIELAYYRQDTDFPVNYNYTITNNPKSFGLGINYILLGGTRYVSLRNSPVEPYAGAMLGIAIIDNKDPLPGGVTSETKFAWELRAGMNIWASKSVGLKLQMQLLSAAQAYGGGFYVGTGGTGAGVSTYSSMFQFAIGGGLTFKFNTR